MAEIIRDTDLSQLEGTPDPERASARFELENCDMEAHLPAWLGGAYIKVSSKTLAGSALAAAIATLLLILAGCLAAAVPLAIDAPAWATVAAGLGLPSGIFLLVRVSSRRERPGGDAGDRPEGQDECHATR
jgi:hypothetical protein